MENSIYNIYQDGDGCDGHPVEEHLGFTNWRFFLNLGPRVALSQLFQFA